MNAANWLAGALGACWLIYKWFLWSSIICKIKKGLFVAKTMLFRCGRSKKNKTQLFPRGTKLNCLCTGYGFDRVPKANAHRSGSPYEDWRAPPQPRQRIVPAHPTDADAVSNSFPTPGAHPALSARMLG